MGWGRGLSSNRSLRVLACLLLLSMMTYHILRNYFVTLFPVFVWSGVYVCSPSAEGPGFVLLTFVSTVHVLQISRAVAAFDRAEDDALLFIILIYIQYG